MKTITFDTVSDLEDGAVCLFREHLRLAANVPHAVMLTGGRTPLGLYRRIAESLGVDALLDGSTPGRLRRLTADQLATGPQASSHGVGVAEALALIDALQGDVIRVVVLGVSTGTPDHGAHSNSLLDTAWPSLQTALDEMIGQYLAQDETAALPPAGAGRYW